MTKIFDFLAVSAIYPKRVGVKIWNDKMWNDQYFGISKLRILKLKKIGYSIVLFLNLFFHYS